MINLNKRKPKNFIDGEWDWPYFDGYTGQGYSDGKFQASVAFGQTKPRTELAWCSRNHDTAFALCSNTSCLDYADDVYADCTGNMSLFPRFVGRLPKFYHGMVGRSKLRGSHTENMGNALIHEAIYKKPADYGKEPVRKKTLRGSRPNLVANPTPITTTQTLFNDTCSADTEGYANVGNVESGMPLGNNRGNTKQIQTGDEDGDVFYQARSVQNYNPWASLEAYLKFSGKKYKKKKKKNTVYIE